MYPAHLLPPQSMMEVVYVCVGVCEMENLLLALF